MWTMRPPIRHKNPTDVSYLILSTDADFFFLSLFCFLLFRKSSSWGQTTHTLNWPYGTLVLVYILHPLFILHAVNCRHPLVCVVRPPQVRILLVSKHPRGDAMVWRRELAAAQLGHGASAAGADDEHLLLAPFAATGHGELSIAVAVAVVVTVAVGVGVGVDVGVVSGSSSREDAVDAFSVTKIGLLREDAKVELEADPNCCRATAVAVVALLELLLERLPGCCAATTRGSRKRASRCSARAQTVAVWRKCGVFVGGDGTCGGAANTTRPGLSNLLLGFGLSFFSVDRGLASLFSWSSQNTCALISVI